LSLIVQLISKMSNQKINYLFSENTTLEANLVRVIVEGTDSNKALTRRLAWKKLVFDIIQGRIELLNSKQQGSTDLTLLVESGIVIEEKIKDKNQYRFSHDLFFEHGLFVFLLDTWENKCTKGKTASFWEKLPNYLKMQNSQSILEKWFVSHESRLEPDLIDEANIIAKGPYFKLFITIAIRRGRNNLLKALLEVKKASLNELLSQELENIRSTYILLAIQSNNSFALNLLLEHGASLYYPHEDTVVTSNESEEEPPISDEESEGFQEYCSEYWERVSCDSDRGGNDRVFSDNEETNNDLLEKFITNKNKYWSTGFYEDPFYEDEGEYYKNPNYEVAPDYKNYYLHQIILEKKNDFLIIFLDACSKRNENYIINLETSDYQETALHIAALKRNSFSVNTLLNYGVSVDSEDAWGETPLHNAVYSGDINSAIFLLKKGANPNALNSKGLSPYHIAFARIHFEMIELLFQYGADLSLPVFNDNEMLVFDIFDASEFWSNVDKEVRNEFILNLINLFNYGFKDNQSSWGVECKKTDEILRKAQFEQVENIIQFYDGPIQLSENVPTLDFWDEESQLDYAIQCGDFEALELLDDYILSNSENIEAVLESNAFSFLKDELLDQWLEEANLLQYKNLRGYAKEYKNDNLLKRLNEGMDVFLSSAIENDNLEHLDILFPYIIEEDDRVKLIFESEQLFKNKKIILERWFQKSGELEDFKFLKNYAKKNKYSEWGKCIDEIIFSFKNKGKSLPKEANKIMELPKLSEFKGGLFSKKSENESKKQTSETILQNLVKDFGLKCQDVARNGRCFFLSALRQLKNVLNLPEYQNITVDHLIYKTIAELSKNRDHYQIFSPDRKLEEVIQDLCFGEGEQRWADDLSIQALINSLNIRIVIVQSNGVKLTKTPEGLITKKEGPTATICLGREMEIDNEFDLLEQKNKGKRDKGVHYQSLEIDTTLEPILDITTQADGQINVTQMSQAMKKLII
jgi:hypothetical protein